MSALESNTRPTVSKYQFVGTKNSDHKDKIDREDKLLIRNICGDTCKKNWLFGIMMVRLNSVNQKILNCANLLKTRLDNPNVYRKIEKVKSRSLTYLDKSALIDLARVVLETESRDVTGGYYRGRVRFRRIVNYSCSLQT